MVAATGTLGQIIPPSIALVLLGDVMSNAYQRAQNNLGIFSQKTVSVGDLFIGAIIPGLLICVGYLIYTILVNRKKILKVETDNQNTNLIRTLFPPFLLIFVVLGSIIAGVATPTEAAGIGALGSFIIATFSNKISISLFKDISFQSAKITTMIFAILIGASIFSLVFRGIGGDDLIDQIFGALPGGPYTALLIILFGIFIIGFILDFIEICYVIVPLIAPPLLMMGFDPVWLSILLAIVLQTSFLTPPFGFSLFYLRGVAGDNIQTKEIYKGVVPFIVIQLVALALVILFPWILIL